MNPAGFLLMAVGLAVVAADNVDFYKDCGSKTGVMKSLDVAGCSSNPCQLPRGQLTAFEVKFDSHVESDTLTAKVYGKLAIGNVKWNGVPADACTGTNCPLKNGESYTYKVNVDVKAFYPPVDVLVKYELQDKNGDDVVCFTVPVKLV